MRDILMESLKREIEIRIDDVFKIVKSNISHGIEESDYHLLKLVFFKRINDINFEEEKDDFWKRFRNHVAHGKMKAFFPSMLKDLQIYFDKINFHDNYDELLKREIIESFDFFSKQPSAEYVLLPIILYLNEVDLSEKNVPKEIMGEIYNGLIEKYYNQLKQEVDFPIILSNLMGDLLNVNDNEKIYCPLSGTGTILINAFKDQNLKNNEFYLQEENKESFTLCIMNMILNKIENFNIHFGDTIIDAFNVKNDSIKKFDRIITKVPVNGLSENQYSYLIHNRDERFCYGLPPRHEGIYAYIQHIIASVKETGKCVILLPLNFLIRGGKGRDIRKQIIKDDLIESIIFLPRGVSYGTSINTILLVINKNKEWYRRKKILLINQEDSRRLSNDNCKEILSFYKDFKEKNNVTKIVDYEEIKDNGFDLNFSRYDKVFIEVKDMLKSGTGVRINDVTTSHRGTVKRNSKFNMNEGFVVVTNSNLKSNIEESTINFKEYKYLIPQDNFFLLKERAIIVSLYNNDLKPTIFFPGREGINEVLLDQTLLAIIPNEKEIDIEYLYYQLYSSNFLKQYDGLRVGRLGRISLKNLLDIIIFKPNIEIQKQQVIEKKEYLLELEKLRYESRIKNIINKDTIQEAEESIIRVLVHNILPDVAAAKLALNRIERFLCRKGLLKEPVEDPTSFDLFDSFDEEDIQETEVVEDVFDGINKYWRTFEEALIKTKETVQLKLEEKDFEEINIKDLLNNIKDLKMRDIENRYEIEVDCPDIYVYLNVGSFTIMIKNLLRNAEIHGFDFKNKSENYKVKFKIIDRGDKLHIEYENNGKSFTITKEEFIKAGIKRKNSPGYGLGGAYVDRVIKAHKGSFKILNSKEGVKMEFELPKKRGEGCN